MTTKKEPGTILVLLFRKLILKLVPQINGLSIRQDSEGRFCLNDLHRAAGGLDKDKPANFLRLESTQGLIQELDLDSGCSDLRSQTSCVNVVAGGKKSGTYVSKLVVYAYASWLSPKFHALVLKTFDLATLVGAERRDSSFAFRSLNECLKLNLDSGASENQKKYLYSNEAKMIDKLALGQPSCSYCKDHDLDQPQLRDYLAKNDPLALEKINWLTKQDEALVNLGFGYEERKETLERLLKTKFVPRVKPVPQLT